MTDTCTYLGNNTQPCGSASLPGKSYCEQHYGLVYQRGTARARRKKDLRVAEQVWSIEDAFNEAVEQLEAEGYDFSEERWEVRELDLD